tara:strand:- start:315 stop:614 length:300 start_codon:yes stop_codon:yes gene_type:complete
LQSGSSGHNVVVAGAVVIIGGGVVVVVIVVVVTITSFIINGICNGKIGAGYIGLGGCVIIGGFVVIGANFGERVVVSLVGLTFVFGTSVVTVHGGGGVV